MAQSTTPIDTEPKRMPRREAEVLRELFFTDPRFTIRGLMRSSGRSHTTIVSLLTNRLHRNEGSEIPHELISAIDHEKRFAIADDQVLGARIAALETGGAFGIDMVAATGDLDRASASDLLTGLARPDVAIFVPFQVIGARPCFNDNEISYWRQRYQTDKRLTTAVIARAVGCKKDTSRKMLHGVSPYNRGTGAVPELRHRHRPRILSDEVALFIRLQFKPNVVTVHDLTKYYRCNKNTVVDIIDHQTYKNVPYVEQKHRGRYGREFTDEQVIAARLDFFSGAKTATQIAREFGLETPNRIYGMLVGERYSDVPGVPAEVLRAAQLKGRNRKRGRISAALRQRKRPVIPVPRVRLLDHDERVDQRLYAAE